ncbi:HNH endonuclease signature motif containing protein [Schlesneria paludicola]|uniref:HNH endonuclease signature motif containing protein n=1 Tax=Schlesneria paludicola TaxID=360056 RepID=UPI00029A17E7|nr:HNH endonuclease signature motif containing protein [Schlesneria paludicola]
MSTAPQKHKPPTVGIKAPRSYHRWYRLRAWWGPVGLRANQLSKEPLCRTCQQAGRIRPATDVDHIRRHGGKWSLFCDASNLQSLCKSCHSEKTARGE